MDERNDASGRPEERPGPAAIVVHREGPVEVLELFNPDRRNALTREMARTLLKAVLDFEADDLARVLVFRGTGKVAFSSGADLKEMADQDAQGVPFEPILPSLYEAVLSSSKPTVAALNGDAVGGGFELALCCDFRVAKSGIRVGLPEARLAMVPRYGTALLAQMLPRARALEYVLLAQLVPVEVAERDGLVTSVVDPSLFEAEVARLASEVAAVPAEAVSGVLAVLGFGRHDIAAAASAPAALAAYGNAQTVTALSDFADRSRSRTAQTGS